MLNFEGAEVLCSDEFVRSDKYISKEGTKINHCSKEYNSYVHTDDYKIYQLKANKTILPRDEITCDYDITNKKYPFIAESEPSYNKC